jgi:hypothetical protein
LKQYNSYYAKEKLEVTLINVEIEKLFTVGRIHFLKGSNEAYSGEILSEYFSVKNGKIESTVTVDDSEWYNEHLRLVKALPNDIHFNEG